MIRYSTFTLALVLFSLNVIYKVKPSLQTVLTRDMIDSFNFTNLTSKFLIGFTNYSLTSIEDYTFDSLINIRNLYLDFNKITSIGKYLIKKGFILSSFVKLFSF